MSKKKMQHVKNLAAAVLAYQRPCEQSRSQTSKKTGSKKSDPMPAHWVAGLFARFQALYGHRWTSAIDGIEEQAVAAWADTLAGITGEQIKSGIDTLACEWPPSAPQFRLHCLYASGVPRPAQALDLITSATYKTGTLRERYMHPAVLAAATQVDVFALRRQNTHNAHKNFYALYESLLQTCHDWPPECEAITDNVEPRRSSPDVAREWINSIREAMRS